MASHLQSLDVAIDDIDQLLERASNLSVGLPADDVTAMTSRLVDDTRQLVLDINTTAVSADHVTQFHSTAETARHTAHLALNTTEHAVYDSYRRIVFSC